MKKIKILFVIMLFVLASSGYSVKEKSTAESELLYGYIVIEDNMLHFDEVVILHLKVKI